ncbi:hypothetical protein E2C01_067097 [Portunus trituberculatus]|uniref:Uncharacterized protein n=1 Tax=Portunus trituberculatus TaxID=210409 RepID=A0A5B7HWK2_PORTR|nr:hypothetical protein [Portunus trituberculatus]
MAHKETGEEKYESSQDQSRIKKKKKKTTACFFPVARRFHKHINIKDLPIKPEASEGHESKKRPDRSQTHGTTRQRRMTPSPPLTHNKSHDSTVNTTVPPLRARWHLKSRKTALLRPTTARLDHGGTPCCFLPLFCTPLYDLVLPDPPW